MRILTFTIGWSDPSCLLDNSETSIYYSSAQWLPAKTIKQIYRVKKQATYPKDIIFQANKSCEDKEEVFFFHLGVLEQKEIKRFANSDLVCQWQKKPHT